MLGIELASEQAENERQSAGALWGRIIRTVRGAHQMCPFIISFTRSVESLGNFCDL